MRMLDGRVAAISGTTSGISTRAAELFGTGLGADAADEGTAAVRSALVRILPQVQPLTGTGVADDVADAVLYLASDRSRMVSGRDLVVDGASVAGRTAAATRAHHAILAGAFVAEERA